MSGSIDSTFISPVIDSLEQLRRECAALKDGKVATYIPELAKANPDWFGICVVTTNGAIYEVGDSRQPFTIQSISKPIMYGLALEDNGRQTVLQKVGVEPTGDAFNSISLDPGTGRPRNPMINAGAIATSSMIAGRTPQQRLKRVLETMGQFAGRKLALDDAVYRSESETGHRNRAIGYMLRNFDILSGDPTPVVELYFQQCSVSVDCRDLGVMAATLANRGLNPLTGRQAIRGEYVESVLSVMESCGMYDYAGEWIYKIGMPAKSGVSGGILAVLPGQLGIGVFSPLLDSHGNSVRGIRACQELSRLLDLHLFNRPGIGKSTLRLKFTGADLNSSRVRTPRESQTLREAGRSIQGYQLQGHLAFASAEIVQRDVIENLAVIDYLIIDLKRVLGIDESSSRLFYQLLVKLKGLGKAMVFTHTDHVPLLRRYMKVKLAEQFDESFRVFGDNDLALEWCENSLLQIALPNHAPQAKVTPRGYELLDGLNAKELDAIISLFKDRSYQRGQTIIAVGDEAREIFFLAEGTVSVVLNLPNGSTRRLATFSPGMCFGEMAFLDGAPRSAKIVADTDVHCHLLGLSDFEKLGSSHPGIKIKVLENLALNLCRKLRKANRELSVFE